MGQVVNARYHHNTALPASDAGKGGSGTPTHHLLFSGMSGEEKEEEALVFCFCSLILTRIDTNM